MRRISISSILPKRFIPARKGNASSDLSAQFLQAAHGDAAGALAKLETAPSGLTQQEAENRLAQHGPNALAKDEGHGRLVLLGKALVNPLVILLALLATVSLLTGDARAAIVMTLMVVLGVSLRFVQEARADTAAKKLRAMIRVTATVVRDGTAREVPLAELVPGDIVNLAAGDMIPADVRLISARTSSSSRRASPASRMPVEKFDAAEPASADLRAGAQERLLPRHQRRERHGHGGRRRDRRAHLPRLASPSAIVGQQVQTSFDKGVSPVHLADDPLHRWSWCRWCSSSTASPRATGRRPSSSRWRSRWA